MKQPKVSFIIPYFNAGLTIDETISSIQNQSYKNYDIWLINDGSTDAFSIKKLEELKHIEKLTLLHIPNSGPGIARNIAIEKTDAEFIFPLDSDDRIKKNAIIESLEEFENESSLGVVFGNGEFFGESNGIKRQMLPDEWSFFIINPIANAALIKKEIFGDIGYYDENLSRPGLEDWELWIRVFFSKWKMKHINKVYFEIRVQKSSRTYREANKNLDEIYKYVYSKHAKLLFDTYKTLYYRNRQLNSSLDKRIGAFFLSPYRFLKKIIK